VSRRRDLTFFLPSPFVELTRRLLFPDVLLDQPYDQETFDRVIHACGLRQDLDKLPKGEHSMLGERGVSLSGGQRQRLVSSSLFPFANAFNC